MARYRGPKSKITRRFKEAIFGPDKALERRPYGPGQHGPNRRRKKESEYSVQLAEKQKAKYTYGILERQFRNMFERAQAKPGITGEVLLQFCELRLDNVAFRAGWASTRPQARQFVNHGLMQVNGRRVDIPSFRVRKGDVVTLSPKAAQMIVIQHNIDVLDRSLVGWLEAGDGGKQVTVRDLPQRDHIDVPVRESLIVELYSK